MAKEQPSLNVPKPAKGRNVAGFSAKAPSELKPSKRAATSPKPRRATKRTARPSSADMQMVRVHTSVSVEVALALRDRTDEEDETQTEILADSFVAHGDSLVAEFDAGGQSQYEALGFRRRRSSPRRGRMNATFYMSKLARNSLDDAAGQAGFESRSAFVDALLRRHLGLPD